MQKLHVESHLPVTPEVCWDVFESEAFRTRLSVHTGLLSELLDEHDEGPVNVRRLKYTSGNDLPGVVAKALGAKRLSYEQINRLDLSRGRLDWVVHLPKIGDRVTVAGITSAVATPTGCTRIVSGEIEVKIPLIGGQIEKAVVGEFQKSMERAVDLARTMIAERSR